MMEGAAGHLGENGAMNNNEPSVSFPKEEEPDVSSSTAGVERGANDASAMLEAALQAGGILSSSSDMDYDPTTSTSLSLNGYTPSSSFLPTEFGAPMVTSSSAPSYHTVVSTDSNNQTVLFSTSQFTTSNNHFVGTSTTSMIPTTTVKTSTVQSSMMSQLKTVPIPPPRASKNGPNNNRYHVASKSSESVFVVKPKAMSSASLVDMYAKVSMDLADRAQASPQLAVGRKSSAYTLNSYVKMSTAPLVPRKAEKKRKPTPPTEGTTNGEVPDKQAPPTATPVPAKKKKEQPRKYACDVCGKAFTRSSHVVDHKRLHTGEKPFVCDYCDKAFSKQSHLTSHRRTHTGEKPHTCSQCGKHFTMSCHLVQHQKIHTGWRPFQCTTCNKTFSEEQELQAHLVTHVPVEERQRRRLMQQEEQQLLGTAPGDAKPAIAQMEPAPPPLPVPKTPVIKHHVPQQQAVEIKIPIVAQHKLDDMQVTPKLEIIGTFSADQICVVSGQQLGGLPDIGPHQIVTSSSASPITSTLQAIPVSISQPIVVSSAQDPLQPHTIQIQTLQPLQELQPLQHHVYLPSQQIIHPPPPPPHPF